MASSPSQDQPSPDETPAISSRSGPDNDQSRPRSRSGDRQFEDRPRYNSTQYNDRDRSYNRRSSFEDTRSSSRNSNGSALSRMEPMDTYKLFMMRQDENATPEVYLKRYDDYKQKYQARLMRAFFDDHKREEWLQQRYSPALIKRSRQLTKEEKAKQAQEFIQLIKSSSLTISFDEPENETDTSKKRTRSDMEEDTEPAPTETSTDENTSAVDKNDVIDCQRMLYIRRVPCSCPESALVEVVKKSVGEFQSIYLSDPAKKPDLDFDRSAWIVFATPAEAKEALPKLQNAFLQDADMTNPIRLQVAIVRSRANLRTPSSASLPQRITVDYHQAKELALALDKEWFQDEGDEPPTPGIEAVLDAKPEMEEKQALDIIIAYLRRVHYFVYYSAQQCSSMGDVLHTHPAIFLRPKVTERDVEEDKSRLDAFEAAQNEESTNAAMESTNESTNQEEKQERKGSCAGNQRWGGWMTSLDEKVQSLMLELKSEKYQEQKAELSKEVAEVEKLEEDVMESVFKTYVVADDDGVKQRCNLCNKLFKNAFFVKKHLRNKHPEVIVDKTAKASEEYMWKRYENDSQRPTPEVKSGNNVTLGQPRRGGSYNGQRHYRDRGPSRDYYGRNQYGAQSYGRGRGSRGGGYRGGRGGMGPRFRSYGGGGPGSYGRESRGPPPASDPREISKSYQDLDNLQDTKVELNFNALSALPPPKKKRKAE